MLRSHSLSLALLLALGAFSAQARDFEKVLKGDYAFAGEATCLISFTGFNSNLEPNNTPGGLWPRVLTFSIQGVRSFNGDGTGRVVARVVSLSHPFALPTTSPVFFRGNASSADLVSDFTYTVSPDLTVNVITPVVTGTVLTGGRATQTVTITHVPPFTGFVSEGLDSLTLAHAAPGIEHHHFSNGDSDQRICHRTRIFHQRKPSKP